MLVSFVMVLGLLYIICVLKYTQGIPTETRILNECIRNNQFRCNSGQCIPINLICDGTPHCTDKSDENEYNCLIIRCPEDMFQCKYGACVKKSARCNGIRECNDGSDENEHACGDMATCNSIPTTNNMKVACFLENVELKNCTKPLNGTVAKFRCDDFYEFSAASETGTRYCLNGAWDRDVPHCKPVCGEKSVAAETDDTKRDHPWQIALYDAKSKLLLCGAAMISQTHVLTAAHCVTIDSSSKLRLKESIIIAAGKYYRNFNDTRDKDAQFSKVKEIATPREYDGERQNYSADIAILFLETPFTLTKSVLPVCVGWMSNLEEVISASNITGVVIGWDFTHESSSASETLQEHSVSYIDRSVCSQHLQFQFRQYLTNDKFCAGFLNQSKSACFGDSGGGLVFQNPQDLRYYVVGIVSLAPRAATSNSQHYGLYTRVYDYINFIKSQVNL